MVDDDDQDSNTVFRAAPLFQLAEIGEKSHEIRAPKIQWKVRQTWLYSRYSIQHPIVAKCNNWLVVELAELGQR